MEVSTSSLNSSPKSFHLSELSSLHLHSEESGKGEKSYPQITYQYYAFFSITFKCPFP